MSSLIQIKNTAISGSAPTNLAQGELAINVTDGKLFYGSSSANIVKEFTGSASGGGGGTINTGSFLTTASFNAYTGSNTSQFAGTASFALTSSRATTASYALNGGVTQLLAGSNVTLSPASGLGQVTVSATLSGSTIFNTATGSYGSFYDTTTQTNPVANVPRSMSLNETDISNGVSVSGSTNPFNTYIKTQNAGVYDIQFSAQVEKTDSGTDEIVIWLRKNGTDLTDTATTITLSGNNAKQVAAWNWFVTSAANDYYQIIWTSADTGMRLLAETISATHPGIPSVIVTANRVDQFLSNTGSFSGSFTGQFTGSLFGTSSWATNALTASFITGSTNAFIQGGNSFGATALLGTNDNQSLALETSGSTRMFISSSGNVGIGTTTPAFTLDVSGSARVSTTIAGNYVAISAISSQPGIIFGGSTSTTSIAGDSDNFIFRTNKTTVVGNCFSFQNGQGNIANLSGTTNGIVAGAAGSVGFNPTSGTGVYNSLLINDRINQTGGASGITRGLYVNPTLTAAADFRSIETTAGNVLFQSGSTPLLFVSQSGRVGIGTNNPLFTLDVSGSIRSSTLFGSDASAVRVGGSTGYLMDYSTGGAGDLRFYYGGGGGWSYNWYTNNTHRARISDTGLQVGAGNVDSSARLQVRGSGATSATTTFLVQNSTPSTLLSILDNGNTGIGLALPSASLHISGASSAALLEIDSPAVNNILFVSGSGRVGIGTSTLTSRLQVQGAGATSTTTAFLVQNSNGSGSLTVNDAGDVFNKGVTNVTANTFFGENVGRASTGNRNTFVGYLAGRDNRTGTDNTLIGAQVGSASSGSSYVTAIGSSILSSTNFPTGNNYTTVVGGSTGNANLTGDVNTFVGWNNASELGSGFRNIGVGYMAFRGSGSSSNNVFIGTSVNKSTGSYNQNTSVGNESLYSHTSGNSNVAVGYRSGRYMTDGTANEVSSNSVFIGFDTRPLSSSQTNQIVIGDSAIGLGSNTAIIGNSSITRTALRGSVGIGTTTPSASLDVSGSAIIASSLVVGSSSLGPNENTVTLGARDAVNEGGQIGFNAPGGTHTSASFIDHYQNRLRILKGTNAGSTAEVAWWSMNNLQMALPGYTNSGSFPGTGSAVLTTDTSGNVITQAFRDVAEQVYTGAIAWTGTAAPSGSTNHTYRWSQVGKTVNLNIVLSYTGPGNAVTAVTMALPADCPTPYVPSGQSGAGAIISIVSAHLTTTNNIGGNVARGALRINPTNNGYELAQIAASAGYKLVVSSVQYFAV
jgi:hypothetical protein